MSAIVTKPGVYDLEEADYHADPVPEGSLSCSGAKLLLPPNCPAIYQWLRKNPRRSTRAMEYGTAAHREVLGRGWPLAVWDGDDWRKKAAQEFAEAARLRGEVPILAREREQISEMAAVVRAHPYASALLQGGEVMPERSFFWRDDLDGLLPEPIWRRARFDAVNLAGRVIIAEFKTAYSADQEEFAKAAGRLRYHMQDPWYRRAVTAILGDVNPLFIFVAQGKDPPYPVAIYQLGAVSREAGEARNAYACRLFARCQAAGEWPGYQLDDQPIIDIDVPRWAL